MLDVWSAKQTNSLIGGHYLLKKRLAGGGFSDVWLAYDERSMVDVVLKIFTANQDMDEQGFEMFRKEFAIVCNLSHSNILKPFTIEIIHDTPCLVLPYCERGSAQQLVGEISENDLWMFVEQVASGLAYLHKHNIIHQDIKPGNVLIDSDGQYLITDFGVSTGLRNTKRFSGNVDVNGELGTIAYMSYECASSKPINSLSRDIWAFGATIYELAYGDVPFGEYGGLTQKADDGRGPKCNGTIQLSDDMKYLIDRCLSFNPWDRPSAQEVLEMVQKHKINQIVRPKAFKWKPYAVGGIVAATIFVITEFVIHWEPVNPVIINPNDSIRVAVCNEASDVILAESKKSDPLTINPDIIADVASKYVESLKLNVTDTIASQTAVRWEKLQTIIDCAFENFQSAARSYGEINAASAEALFEEKSRKLEPFISKNMQTNYSSVYNGNIN